MVSIPKKIHSFLINTLSRQKPSKDDIGKAGEEAIARYIQQLGWNIIERNWRPEGAYHGLELDIIAQNKETLIFIEVKTRVFSQAHLDVSDTTKNIQAVINEQKKDAFQKQKNVETPRQTSRSPVGKSLQQKNRAQESIPAYASFTKKKQNNILHAARHYLSLKEMWDAPCQFDLFCVQEDSEGTFGIEHYEHVIEVGQTMDSGNTHWQPW